MKNRRDAFCLENRQNLKVRQKKNSKENFRSKEINLKESI